MHVCLNVALSHGMIMLLSKTIDYVTETPKLSHRKILFDFFDQGAPRNSLKHHGLLSLPLISSQNLRIGSYY